MNPSEKGKKSVLLLSGGLDSAANLAFCVSHDLPVLALTADYGQRAARREIQAARLLCDHYQVPHQIVDLRWLGALGGSSLTESSLELPELGTQELDDLAITRVSARSVWVPNRNGVLIHVAAAHAERSGAERVVVGFNREEAATFPDNSQDFIRQVNASLKYSTATQVEVFCYSTGWNKREIVTALRKLARPFPFELVWSCYSDHEAPCGVCESCRRLARAVEN